MKNELFYGLFITFAIDFAFLSLTSSLAHLSIHKLSYSLKINILLNLPIFLTICLLEFRTFQKSRFVGILWIRLVKSISQLWAALEAQFWLFVSLQARASSSGYEVEAQFKVRLKLKVVSLKLSSFQVHERISLKKNDFLLNSTIIFDLEFDY